MLSHKLFASTVLLALAVLFSGGNVWVVAARSTIPVVLDGKVLRKELRHEKHPGKDDVHFVYLNSTDVLHVDGRVYDTVEVGDDLKKSPWSKTLFVNGEPMQLVWSRDIAGMIVAMPSIVLVIVSTLVYCLRRPVRCAGTDNETTTLREE